MAERMTREQINQAYPEQYVGLRNPVYVYGALESAEVAYVGENQMMLFMRQIWEPNILIWYTGANPPLCMGLFGIF